MATETISPAIPTTGSGAGEATAAGAAAPAGAGSQFWCNFCDYRTDSAPEYLSHSCKDVLARRGVAVVATGRNECS